MADERIRLALVGAGATGSPLLELLLGHNHIVDVVMVVDSRPDAPGMAVARAHGIPTAEDITQVMRLKEKVDLIVDVTGDPGVKTALRLQLQLQNNRHTVIMHEKIVLLILSLMQGKLVSGHETSKDYA